MLASLALLFAALTPCQAQGALRVYLEPDSVAASDTVFFARLCLSVPTAGPRLASISGRIVVDTAFAAIARVELTAGSALVARDNGGGMVLLAGASAQGLRGGTLMTLRATLSSAGVLPRMSVVLTELNESSGQSLATQVGVSGLSPRCVGDRTAIFEVLPLEASAQPGEPLDLHITGCGFDAAKNTVRFGALTLRNITSTDGGTRIRVVIPKDYTASGEVAPMQIGAGTYDVTVDNGRRVSNARRVTLR